MRLTMRRSPAVSTSARVIVAVTFLPALIAARQRVKAALAALLVPFGAIVSIAEVPAASVLVRVVSMIALETPAILTEPFAVTTRLPPAGAVTFVPIESVEPDSFFVPSGAIVDPESTSEMPSGVAGAAGAAGVAG